MKKIFFEKNFRQPPPWGRQRPRGRRLDSPVLDDLNFLDHLEINMVKLNQRAFDYNYALTIVYIGGYVLFKNKKTIRVQNVKDN